jgi:hypothetical protein
MFFASAALLACHAKGADLPSQQQAAPAKPAPLATKSCFASLYDFLSADPDDCPLAWNGIRLYGRFDYGAGYDSHGVPLNGNYPNGVETLISKNSNGARFTLVPNGLGQTHVGVKGEERIVSDWSLVLKFENGFDPYTLQRAKGRSRWLRTTPLRSTRKLRTAIRAGQGSSSTPRRISDSAIRLTVNCLRGGRTPLSPTARAALTPWTRRQAFP